MATCEPSGCTIWDGDREQSDSLACCPPVVDTVADIRSYPTDFGAIPRVIYARGLDWPGDGSGGLFNIQQDLAPGSFSDDGRDTVVFTGGDGSSAAIRKPGTYVYSGVPEASPEDIGAHINNLIQTTTGNIVILVPDGVWPQKTQINLPAPVTGAGIYGNRIVSIIGESPFGTRIYATQAMESQISQVCDDFDGLVENDKPEGAIFRDFSLDGQGIVNQGFYIECSYRWFFARIRCIDHLAANYRFGNQVKHAGTNVTMGTPYMLQCRAQNDPELVEDRPVHLWHLERTYDGFFDQIHGQRWEPERGAFYVYTAGENYFHHVHLTDGSVGFESVDSDGGMINNCQFDSSSIGITLDADSDYWQITNNIFYQLTQTHPDYEPGNQTGNQKFAFKFDGTKHGCIVTGNKFKRIAGDFDPAGAFTFTGTSQFMNNAYQDMWLFYTDGGGPDGTDPWYTWTDSFQGLENGKMTISNVGPGNTFRNQPRDLIVDLVGQDLFPEEGSAPEKSWVGIRYSRVVNDAHEKRWLIRMSGQSEDGLEDASTYQIVRSADGSAEKIAFSVSRETGLMLINEGIVINGSQDATDPSQQFKINVRDDLGQTWPSIQITRTSTTDTLEEHRADGSLWMQGFVPDAASNGTITIQKDISTPDGTPAYAVLDQVGASVWSVDYNGFIDSQQLVNMQSEIDTLESEMSAAQSEISTLQSQVSSLESRVTALENP